MKDLSAVSVGILAGGGSTRMGRDEGRIPFALFSSFQTT